MRLIAHNLLKCNTRELKENEGYPLIIRAESTEIIPMDYNEGKKLRRLRVTFLVLVHFRFSQESPPKDQFYHFTVCIERSSTQ